MEQTATVEPIQQNMDPMSAEPFNKAAQSGWNFFTKFLFWNVISVIVSLFIIGLLTVWS